MVLTFGSIDLYGFLGNVVLVLYGVCIKLIVCACEYGKRFGACACMCVVRLCVRVCGAGACMLNLCVWSVKYFLLSKPKTLYVVHVSFQCRQSIESR